MQLLPSISSHTSNGRKHRHNVPRSAWWVHMIGAIALVAGLFLPLTDFGQAIAAPDGSTTTMMQRNQSASDTVPPAPAQVTAIGDFQSEVGCNEFDASCQSSQLVDHAGIWTGVFALPPGNYSWQIAAVAPDGNVVTYGQGGLGGGAQQVSVDEGDAGVYFELDTHTNEAAAEAVSGILSVQVNGSSVALQPDNGQLSAYVTSPQGGSANVQVFSGADPLGGSQQAQLNAGANRLTFSPEGQVVNVESLTSGSVTIQRLDASGNPLSGGCYQLVSGGTLVNQGCDADDGADGSTSMTFPEGIPTGNVTVVEVTPPDGAEALPDAEVALESGNQVITLQPEAAEPEETETEEVQEEDGQVIEADDGEEIDEATEPADAEPGDLVVTLEDQEGNPIGGACFALLRDGNTVTEICDTTDFESPDFANNGLTGFFGVPSGTYTLRLTQAPVDVSAEDREVEVPAGDQANETVTVEVATPTEEVETETPTEEPTQAPTETQAPTDTPEPDPGNLTVTLLDQDGDPVGGACFQLLDNGNVVAESCDTSDWESAEFANNGNTGFFDVPAGTHTLRMTSGPDDLTVEDRQVEVEPGGDTTETVNVQVETPTQEPTESPTEVPTETPTQELTETPTETPAETPAPQPGDFTVTLVDQNGDPIGGTCFALLQDGDVVAESCDTPEVESAQFANNGNTGFFGVPAGTYTLQMTSAPDDVSVEDREVQVEGGTEVIETIAADVSTPAETATATEEPTPTETATEEEDGQPGDLLVTLETAEGEPVGNACFQLLDDGDVVAESCDTAQYEQSPGNGTTGFYGVPSGTYTLRNTDVPDEDLPLVEDREVEVDAGEQSEETVELPEADEPSPTAEPTETPTEEPTPTETPTEAPTATATEETDDAEPGPPGDQIVTLQDQVGDPIGGACFQIEMEGQAPIEVCDSDDPFPGNGNTGFFGVPSGTYTLTQTVVPEGTNPIEPREITIQPGDNENLIVTPGEAEGDDGESEQPPPEGTGGRVAVDTSDIPEETVCVELDTTGGIGFVDPPSACDNGEGDESGEPGQIEMSNVRAGNYTLNVVSGPEDVESQQIAVQEGETTTVELGEDEPTTGTLTINVTDPGGSPLAGACFEVTNSTGTFEFCDDDDGNEDGTVEIEDVAFGAQTIVQTEAPEGYSSAPEQSVDVNEDNQNVELNVVNNPATGSIRVVSEDTEGNPLAGACVSIDGGELVCDQDGDGVLNFDDVPAGDHTVAQTTAPEGYSAPEEDSVDVEVDAGEQSEVRFTNTQQTGTIHVVIEDEEGNRLPGACVSVDGGEPLCDVDEVGEFTFQDVPTGEHTVSQTTPPQGYQTVEDQAVTVEPNETTEVTFTNAIGTGTIRVVSETADGTDLPGACVAIDGGEPVCDQDGDGVLIFEQVPAGDHTVAQTTAPEGYEAAPEQTVTVESGETVEARFTNEPATGSIVATVLDDEGNPVAGVCVGYAANGGDPQTLCEPEEDGTYRFDNVAPGTYQVTVSQVPDEYVTPDPEQVEVIAGQDATVEFQLSTAPPQTGNAILSLQSEDGQAAVGVCILLTEQDSGEQLGPYCDNGEGDGDATEGVLLLEDIPVGVYEVTFPNRNALAFAGSALLTLQDDGESITIEIIANQTIQEVIIVPGLEVLGGIEIRTVDAATSDPVPGACYSISTAEPTVVCDGGDGDESTDAGTILVTELPPGDYTVSMTTVPDGYAGADDQSTTVVGGETSTLEFALDAEPMAGRLTVSKVDDAGEALPGACFRLQNDDGVVATVCDDDDGDNDGTISFSDIPAGTYQLVETRTPGNAYQAAPNRTVEIGAGEDVAIEVVNSDAPGRLNVIKVDAADQSVRLDNACFRLDGNTTYGPFCDGDDQSVDGRTVFTGVQPGTYTLVETQSPSGYDPAPDREVTIRAGVTLQVTVQNQETPPPPEAGTLVVNKIDGDGETLAGGCFRLFDGDSPATAQVCDITDGTNDGRIVFEDVPAGTWTLRETLAPSPSYRLAPDQEVTIEDDTTTEVDVVNEFKSGRILVQKVTESHKKPIEGACFELDPDQGEPLCSNAAGEILFENIPVGTYTLVETTAPYGFEEADPVEDIVVNPGQTTVVTVENVPEPPPNTGSVQVLKFVCPVDLADDERTSFLGGAAGQAQLAETQGCAPSNAEFTLVGEDGQDGPGAFSIGDDGQYQVTVPAKIYRLDETNPDLPGNSAALLRVEVGRLTTVVVINYVAPPEPEPVNISMAKYTCQAGFNGTTFQDFAESCMSDEQLANNITFRAEGPEEDLKAVTGDGGQTGRTAFTDQPSGTWTIYEERPYNIPTNYGFCGWDSNWPADFKTVNGAITAELDEGENLHCVFFNIPEEITDSTGVILVRKYTCYVEAPPKGYDFANECVLSDENQTFELRQYNEEMDDYGEATQATANPDGILRFSGLRSGSYQLREVDSSWCYANSNSVNTRGDVVVRAGQVSLVSIYNCVAPSEPPNTGSGAAAGLFSPQEPEAPAPGGSRVTPGAAWPVLIIAVILALRPRRVLAPGHDWSEPDRDAA